MYKALILDDEPIILEGLKQVIHWESFGVKIVADLSDSFEAFSYLKNNPIDIMITDIKMPDMDGLQLIEKIRSLNFRIKIIILSGYDDFKYVKKAAVLGIENYLLKPIDEQELSMTIQHTVEKLARESKVEYWKRKNDKILRENILNRWLSENITDSELSDRAEFLGIDLRYEYYLVTIVHILRLSCKSDNMLSYLPYAVKNICSELLQNYCNAIIFNNISGDTVIIYSGKYSDFNKELLNNKLSRIVKELKNCLKISSVVTCGSLEKGYQSAPVSYRHAFELLNCSFLYPNNKIIHYAEMQRSHKKSYQIIEIDYSDLKSAVYQKNIVSVNRFIDKIYYDAVNANNLPMETIKELFIEIFYNIFGTLEIHNITSSLEKNNNSIIDILENYTIPELFKWLKEITASYIKKEQYSNDNLSPVINSVIKYIDQHFNEDLSLKKLSDIYHINAAYLGQLFKKETGEIFSGFLNKYRIEKAKKLLISTSLKENDIATRVGYSNINYFLCVFKKIVGISPSNYKISRIK